MTIAACPPSTSPVLGVVVFNFAEFIAIYPELTTAAQAAALNNFTLATLMLSNCCRSPVRDANVRQMLLYMLTAHITFLMTPCGANSNQPPGLVGRINSAAEGSVSVSSDMPASLSSAYFMQTKYGAQFWQSTAAFRTMQYVPGTVPIGAGANFPPGGWWNGNGGQC